MGVIVKSAGRRNKYKLIRRSTFGKKEIVKTLGQDFFESVANIIGLVSLLEDTEIDNLDFKDVRHYLSVESKKIDKMVREIHN